MTLNIHNIKHLSKEVTLPAYDPRALEIGSVHFGVGNFQRAHLAYYTELALNHVYRETGQLPAWGIAGVSLRSPGMRERLTPQQFCYSLNQCYNNDINSQIIGALRALYYAQEDALALHETLNNINLITMTVTEKAYCYQPATKQLLLDHADIIEDLTQWRTLGDAWYQQGVAKTLLGWLAIAAGKKYKTQQPPPIMTSCDNLANNGDLLKALLVEFTGLIDSNLSLWLKQHLACPNTMVDRITPALTEENAIKINHHLQLTDDAPVLTEKFSQWVIGDQCREQLPAWEHAGAQWVDEVAPFETLKLRCLNGLHSALALLGFAKGYDYIYQTVEDDQLNDYAHHFFNEVSPTLPPVDIDIKHYQQQIISRFANRAVPYKTTQVAMDSSQKLPQRILDTIIECYQHQLPCEHLIQAIAAWMYYVSRKDRQGNIIAVHDPLSEHLSKLNYQTNHDTVNALCAIESIFDDALANNQHFKQQCLHFLNELRHE